MMMAKQVWHISKINAFSLDMLYNSLIQLLLRNRAIASVGFAEEKNKPRALLFSNVYSSLVAIVNVSLPNSQRRAKHGLFRPKTIEASQVSLGEASAVSLSVSINIRLKSFSTITGRLCFNMGFGVTQRCILRSFPGIS